MDSPNLAPGRKNRFFPVYQSSQGGRTGNGRPVPLLFYKTLALISHNKKSPQIFTGLTVPHYYIFCTNTRANPSVYANPPTGGLA
jgi:hypothetical protein